MLLAVLITMTFASNVKGVCKNIRRLRLFTQTTKLVMVDEFQDADQAASADD